uniref:Uncharacterized protein n=1 Tax=Leptobrachium leishanense TaxID=445787 RepID=A0A8C5MP00_9ANUR
MYGKLNSSKSLSCFRLGSDPRTFHIRLTAVFGVRCGFSKESIENNTQSSAEITSVVMDRLMHRRTCRPHAIKHKFWR